MTNDHTDHGDYAEANADATTKFEELDVPTLIAIDKLNGWVRKPTGWDEVGHAPTQELLEKLPQFKATELGIEHRIFDNFTKPTPAVFLLARKGGLYMVRTEGSTYARYIRYIGQTVEKPVSSTLAYVQKALQDTGYNCGPDKETQDPGLLSAAFAGVSADGKEMHNVTYMHEGVVEDGCVYIWTENGKKYADF
jgi:hypothetical protein